MLKVIKLRRLQWLLHVRPVFKLSKSTFNPQSVFRVILRINPCYSAEENKPVGVCDGEVVFSHEVGTEK